MTGKNCVAVSFLITLQASRGPEIGAQVFSCEFCGIFKNIFSTEHLRATASVDKAVSHPEEFCKKGVLQNFAKFTGKQLCQSIFLNKVAGLAWNFVKKENLAQVFPCEFCEISKNTFSNRTPPVAPSEEMD